MGGANWQARMRTGDWCSCPRLEGHETMRLSTRTLVSCAVLVLPAACAAGSEIHDTAELPDESDLGTTASGLTQIDDVMDWLIQDQCGAHPSADPSTCPTDHHNLARGEHLFYNRRDYDPGGYVHNSFPSWSDAEVVINSLDGAPYNVWNIEPAGPQMDGYDVFEASPPYVSGIETRDGCGFAQTAGHRVPARSNGVFIVDNGGILFPTEVPAINTTGTLSFPKELHYWELGGQARPGGQNGWCYGLGVRVGPLLGDGTLDCPSTAASAVPCQEQLNYTTWSRANRTFTNGATLDAITSSVHTGPTLAQSQDKEVFLFTRLYGLTRWESWERGGTKPLVADNVCNGAKLVNDGTSPSWRMIGCREWTKIVRVDAVAFPQGWDTRSWPAPAPRYPTVTYEAEGPGYASWMHGTGAAYGDGWHGNTAIHGPGALLYGPYATFTLDS